VKRTAEGETTLLKITDERARKVAAIRIETAKQLGIIEQLRSAGGEQGGGIELPRGIENWEEITNAIRANADAQVKALHSTSEAAKLASRAVSDFLSAVIVNGAKAQDVLRSIAQTLLSVGIQKSAEFAFGVKSP